LRLGCMAIDALPALGVMAGLLPPSLRIARISIRARRGSIRGHEAASKLSEEWEPGQRP
jgi:hypothetical protein